MTKSNSLLLILIILLLITACSSQPQPTEKSPVIIPTQEATQQNLSPETESASPDAVAPILSTDLIRECKKRERGVKGPQEGDLAIDFTLKDIHGKVYTLSNLLMEKPVVMIFGSFT